MRSCTRRGPTRLRSWISLAHPPLRSPHFSSGHGTTERLGRRSIARSSRAIAAVAVAALVGAGCSGSEPTSPSATAVETTALATDPGASTVAPEPDVSAVVTDAVPAPVTELAAGPVSVIALGDSLTAGEGDEFGLGFVGRLTESIDAVPGRSGSSLTNFGVSGWHSSGMVDGQDGAPGQLGAALVEVEAAVAAGRAVLATVLIGSNDLWYLYEYPVETTSVADEDAAAELYRSNLDRAVRELSGAGATVVLGLPDDQSLRPCSIDIEYLHNFLPNVTVDEIQMMSAMSRRLAGIVMEVAEVYGVRTVDTSAPFWADTSTMADDLIHPNADGYATLAELWFAVIRDLL
jgi:lysophospholipase L1-like esterase